MVTRKRGASSVTTVTTTARASGYTADGKNPGKPRILWPCNHVTTVTTKKGVGLSRGIRPRQYVMPVFSFSSDVRRHRAIAIAESKRRLL